MAYALDFTNSSNHVTLPALTGGNGTVRVCRYDMMIRNYTTQFLFGNSLSGGTSSIRITAANAITIRPQVSSARNVTLTSNAIPLNQRIVLEVFKTSAPAYEVRVDGIVVGSIAITAGEVSDNFIVNFIGASTSTTAKFNGLIYEADIFGNQFLNADQPTASTFGVGTLVGFPTNGTQWVEYGAAVTPIAFNGTIPAQSATVGTPFSLNVSSFFTGNQMPFTYAIQSGTLPAGLTLSGSTISGTPTTEGSATITVRGTDAASNTATSNSFTITVAAAASVPQGTVTIGTVTAAQTTASVPFTYSLSDQTGFQYRLNGGAAVATPSSPINLTGLTASTAYTIEVRAVNAAGSGTWSAVTNFTTQAAVVQGTFTSEPFRRLVDGALMTNKSFTYFRLYNNSTGVLVLNRTGLTSNASGVVTVTDAAIVSGTTYKVDWQTADGEFCMPSKAAT